MKNVLFIVYYFPPMGGSGVQRPLKFAKYLREFGWNPIILCPKPGLYHTFDESLENELHSLNLEIHRVGDGDILQKAASNKKTEVKVDDKIAKRLRWFSRLIYYPDNKKGWIKPALQKANEIISEIKIDLIFTTAPPFSNHIIGQQLKEETGIPLIVDYRDSWTRNHFQEDMWSWQKQILRNQERGVVASADKIICLDDFIKTEFKKDYPEITDRVEVLSHGFDSEDFEKENLSTSFEYKEGKLNLLYSGLFYEQNQPDTFLSALNELFYENPSMDGRIHLHFQGGIDDRIKKLIIDYGFENHISDYGYVSHSIAVKNLLQADALWMISNFDPSLKQIKSGKLFEYIGSQKPILGLVHESEASKLLKNYGAGFWAPPTSVKDIKEQLSEIFKLWEKKELPNSNTDFVNQFDRKKLTEKLAQIFNVISL